MNPHSRNALVTGGTGFLGGRLARRLHADGWRVTVVGRHRAAGRALESSGIRFIRADLADAAAVDGACRGQEIIFHCAARSSPWGRYADFYRDNVVATQNIVAGCERGNVSRLVHVSTPSIYFNFADCLNISETQPPPAKLANHYVRTKLIAEATVDAATARGLAAVTLRPRAIFGPGDTTLFPRLIRAHGAHGFPLIGDGDPLMDITFVENVVDALLLAANAPTSALGKKFNVTNGEPWLRSKLLVTLFAEIGQTLKTRRVNYHLAQCAAALLENLSHVFTLARWEPPLTRYTVGVLAKSQTLDISASRSVLGYKPRVSVADGLHAFGVWWKEKNHEA
jgi:nucleoside-diphosphate-sugar epimerase